LKALGTKVENTSDFEGEISKSHGSGAKIYIANHQSILDALFLQGYIKLPSVILDSIAKFPLPFVLVYLRKYNHSLIGSNDKRSQATAIKKLLKTLINGESVFIFPSAGIRNISIYFSDSIFYLSKKTNSDVVPIFISYKPDVYFDKSLKNSDRKFIIDLMKSKDNALLYKIGKPVSSKEYNTLESFNQHFKKIYKEYN
jgi:1-acyl-sn-glycerol-3-phosphate acyltransferase